MYGTFTLNLKRVCGMRTGGGSTWAGSRSQDAPPPPSAAFGARRDDRDAPPRDRSTLACNSKG